MIESPTPAERLLTVAVADDPVAVPDELVVRSPVWMRSLKPPIPDVRVVDWFTEARELETL